MSITDRNLSFIKQKFADSRVRIVCFSSLYKIANRLSLGFGQTKKDLKTSPLTVENAYGPFHYFVTVKLQKKKKMYSVHVLYKRASYSIYVVL